MEGRRTRPWILGLAWSAACGLGLAAALPAGAQTPVPVGGEFQVNTYTTSNQLAASVAVEANGDFVVVWNSNGSAGDDSSGYSAQGQRFASDGTSLGSEFQIKINN